MSTIILGNGHAPDRSRWVGLSTAIALHAAAVGFLLAHAPAREALREVAPLMVELIPPPSPSPSKPEARTASPPKPLPVRKVAPRPAPQAPVLAAAAPTADAPPVSVPPDPRPLPPLDAKPAAAAPPTPPAAAPVPTVVPPSFQADYLDNPAPAYPALSRRSGEQGRVLLRVHVEANGMPTSVEMRSSSGYDRLDQAALEAVRRWKFVPARLGDKAVAAYVVVPIQFNLRN